MGSTEHKAHGICRCRQIVQGPQFYLQRMSSRPMFLAGAHIQQCSGAACSQWCFGGALVWKWKLGLLHAKRCSRLHCVHCSALPASWDCLEATHRPSKLCSLPPPGFLSPLSSDSGNITLPHTPLPTIELTQPRCPGSVCRPVIMCLGEI